MRKEIVDAVRSSWVMVRLETYGWGGSRTDKNASREVEAQHGAAAGSVRAVKQLLVTAQAELDAVRRIQREMRDYLDSVSVPWSGRGSRLVPTSQLLDVLEQLAKRNVQLREAVNRLASVWDERVQTSKAALGTLGLDVAYPAADDVPKLFGARFSFEPIPDNQSCRRLSLPAEVADHLVERMERDHARAVEEARQQVLERVQAAIVRVRDRMAKKLEGERTQLHESALEELRQTAVLLSELDFDGSLQKLIEEIDAVGRTPVERLREDRHTQELVKVQFDELLQEFPELAA